MRFALDTNAYSGQILNDPDFTVYITAKNEIYIPIIVIAELKAGFAHGNMEKKNLDLLEEFLSAPNVSILHTTETTTDHYADIYTQLRKKGRPINTNDMWIAALCIEHKLPLLTKDTDFTYADNLKLVLKP